MEKKICKTCGMELELIHFAKWRRKDGSLGCASECKFCAYERNNAYRRREANKISIRKYSDEELLIECKRRNIIND